jgi:hypothetical protein
MSWKHVDIEGGLRRLAERRIEDAMKEGKFENLPGAGKPLDLEPMPAEENARLMWWALRILRNHDVTPDEIKWRKTLDNLRAELTIARDERRVRFLVELINGFVYKINTLGTNAMNTAVVGVSLEKELARLRSSTAVSRVSNPCNEARVENP